LGWPVVKVVEILSTSVFTPLTWVGIPFTTSSIKVSRHLPMARGFTSQCVIFVPNNSDSPHIAEVMITQPNPLNLKIPKPNKMKIEKIPLC
jgi:hypothetical protein